jgi:hypothetical protein
VVVDAIELGMMILREIATRIRLGRREWRVL